MVNFVLIALFVSAISSNLMAQTEQKTSTETKTTIKKKITIESDDPDAIKAFLEKKLNDIKLKDVDIDWENLNLGDGNSNIDIEVLLDGKTTDKDIVIKKLNLNESDADLKEFIKKHTQDMDGKKVKIITIQEEEEEESDNK